MYQRTSLGSPWILILLALAMSFNAYWGIRSARLPKIDFGDGIEYLNAAYHLRNSLTYTSASNDAPTPPTIGREPGYPTFLALLMLADAGLDSYRPSCGKPGSGCDTAAFGLVSVANRVLIQATCLLVFLLALRITRSPLAALGGTSVILLNFALLRLYAADPMSDLLAMAILAMSMLSFLAAWQRRSLIRWGFIGLTLACLTLTKAVFLPFTILAIAGTAVGLTLQGSRAHGFWRALTMVVVVYAAAIAGWMTRNQQVSGHFQLTDNRGGIALSTREVFDHMTSPQYAAAFVYWTPGFGPALARRIFAPGTVAPFDLYAPGGFYDVGQNRYEPRVAAVMQAQGVDRWNASHEVDRGLVGDMLRAPLAYAASTVPLLYRGLWIDQSVIGVLPLFWFLWRALRSRQVPLIFLLGVGAYNIVFYALFSLSIPRYQITALPVLALATALGLQAMLERLQSPGSFSLRGAALISASAAGSETRLD